MLQRAGQKEWIACVHKAVFTATETPAAPWPKRIILLCELEHT
jgi:hypothetical protein